MKTRHEIYNFDHGLKHPCNVDFGPFTIIVNEKHCENLVRIPHDEKYTFTYDNSDLTRVINEEPKIEGGWIETSILEIDEKRIEKSLLYGENSHHNNIDDLCLILSFLTGRRVLHGNDIYINSHNPAKHVDKVVHKGFILRPLIKWDDIEIIQKKNLGIQFYNLTLAYECNDLIAKGAYVNSVFNVLYEKHFTKRELKRELKKTINEKTGENITIIENYLKNEIEKIVQQYCKNENIHSIIKDDLEKRLNTLWTPTATTKIELFLESIGLYHGYTKEEKDRLSWLSKVRNHFAHNGDIPKDKNYLTAMRMEISSSIISVVLRIAQFYFASQILKIDDPYIQFIKNQIFEYFNKGIFSGKKIFDETHEQYMIRTKKEWIGVE